MGRRQEPAVAVMPPVEAPVAADVPLDLSAASPEKGLQTPTPRRERCSGPREGALTPLAVARPSEARKSNDERRENALNRRNARQERVATLFGQDSSSKMASEQERDVSAATPVNAPVVAKAENTSGLVPDLCAELASKMRPHQIEGVQFLLKRVLQEDSEHCGAILADDMGMGKTVQTVAAISVLLSRASICRARCTSWGSFLNMNPPPWSGGSERPSKLETTKLERPLMFPHIHKRSQPAQEI